MDQEWASKLTGSDASQPSSTPLASGTVNPYSCLPCRERKKKCDRIKPCSNCHRLGIECRFVPRRVSTRQPASVGIQERLRHLEAIINRLQNNLDPATAQGLTFEGLGAQEPIPEDAELTPQSYSSAKTEEEMAELGAEYGKLAMANGRSRYVIGNFWASLDDEVEDLKSLLQGCIEELPLWDLNVEETDGMPSQASILGFGPIAQSLLHFHPPAEQITLYWNLFKENCDKLIKVLHIPTTESLVLQAARRLHRLPRGLEALMMAMYFAVVVSLSPSECLQILRADKLGLIRKYKAATEQAMARAGLLETDEIITIQAFTIFLTSLRIHDSVRVMSTLTALLIRLAQNAGIHRDGTHFGLPPFVVEMRRRLWWSICVLASRSAEDTGYDATFPPGSVDTQLPLNVNDSDLLPSMTQLPQPSTGLTEMTFSVVRFESTKVFRQLQNTWRTRDQSGAELTAPQILEKKSKIINDIQNRVHELYLKHLDLSDPLSWYTSTICRIVFTKMWLVTYHPYLRSDESSQVLESVKDRLFAESTTAIECWLRLNEEKSTLRWRWLCETYVQWYSLAFLLSELCKRTHGNAVDRAWAAVDGALRLGSRIYSSSCQRAGIPVRQKPDNGEPSCESCKPLSKLLRRAHAVRNQSSGEAGTAATGQFDQNIRLSRLDAPHDFPMNKGNLDPLDWAPGEFTSATNPYILSNFWPNENLSMGNDWLSEDACLSEVQLGNWPMFNIWDSAG